jgi:hypothetical protein
MTAGLPEKGQERMQLPIWVSHLDLECSQYKSCTSWLGPNRLKIQAIHPRSSDAHEVRPISPYGPAGGFSLLAYQFPGYAQILTILAIYRAAIVRSRPLGGYSQAGSISADVH